MACEFKRAGFLEGEAIETPLPIGLKPSGDLQIDRDALRLAWLKTSGDLPGGEDLRALVQANSAVGLLGPHFKKTAPFEFI